MWSLLYQLLGSAGARHVTFLCLPSPLFLSPPLPYPPFSSLPYLIFFLSVSSTLCVCMCACACMHVCACVIQVQVSTYLCVDIRGQLLGVSSLLPHCLRQCLFCSHLSTYSKLDGGYNARQSSCLPAHLPIGMLGLEMCLMASSFALWVQRLNCGCQAYATSTFIP